MRLIVFILCLLTLSCGSLPKDIAPNYADLGYRSLEFIIKDTPTRPERTQLGNATIMLKEGESLVGKSFTIYGLYQGVFVFYSQGCPWINYSFRYSGKSVFNLIDLMIQPTNCQIRIAEMVDQINGLEHDVHEIGVLDVYVLPKDKQPLTITYPDSSQFGIKLREFVGNAAVQRQSGQYTNSNVITLKFNSAGGVLTVNSSCPDVPKQRIEYLNTWVDISMKSLYGQGFTAEGKDCDFFFMSVPALESVAYYGKIMVSMYKPEVVLLEYPTFNIHWFGKHLEVKPPKYVAISCINEYCSKSKKSHIDNEVDYERYNKTDTFWIRSLTTNGRKSIYAIKDSKVVWW